MRSIDVAERRARLARRHRLAAGQRASDVEEAAESMVCLHATDPSTVYLSAWARVDGMTVPDLERALYVDRSLVKHLAMRRTLFVFPRATLSVAQAGASNRVADTERRRLIRDVEKAGLQRERRALARRRRASRCWRPCPTGGRPRRRSCATRSPRSRARSRTAKGSRGAGKLPVGPRVLTTLSAAGRIVRASNDGGWTTSRPRWTSTASWLGEEIEPLTEAEGVAGLVERWLRAFGPGTRRGHQVVARLDRHGGQEGAGRPRRGRGRPGRPDRIRAARRPGADPTGRAVGGAPAAARPDHDGLVRARLVPRPATRAQLFDTNGNAGPTAWWDGRIVGGWRQTEAGEVELQLLEDVGKAGRRALDARGDAPDRVARRHARGGEVPLTAVEAAGGD